MAKATTPKGFTGQPFNLAELAAEKGFRSGKPLRPIRERLSAERALQREANGILRALSEHIRDYIIPAYGRDFIGDDQAENWASQLGTILAGLLRLSRLRIERIIRGEGDRHTRAWKASVKGSIRVDLDAVVREEDLAGYLELASTRSFSLIQGMADDLIRNLERVFRQAVLDSTSTNELRKLVRKRLNISKNRARLIARDQTATLVSELNKARQVQAGITEYEWSTSRDERVRERHQKLHGRRFKWGESTPAEGGDAPGVPINCRCVAIPIL